MKLKLKSAALFSNTKQKIFNLTKRGKKMIIRQSVKLGKDRKKLTLGPNLGPLN